MNKVVAILGVIILITLGALFFFAGFYMGNTTTFGKSSETASAKKSNDKTINLQEINAQIAAQSNNVSEKVMKIISGSANNISDSVSKVVTKISYQKASHMSADSLLKEILASHSEHDDCSVQKTANSIQSVAKFNKDSLRGKKVVFIGYFKDNIALQIQQLLANKGYKVHVEESKTCPGESFIFCGPFRRRENAYKLVNWLKDHDFSEAKVINIIQESIEKAIADTMDDDSNIPENEEEEIPEIDESQLQKLTDNEQLSNNIQNSIMTNIPANYPQITPGPTPSQNFPAPNFQQNQMMMYR